MLLALACVCFKCSACLDAGHFFFNLAKVIVLWLCAILVAAMCECALAGAFVKWIFFFWMFLDFFFFCSGINSLQQGLE